jgi:hypothetical protein
MPARRRRFSNSACIRSRPRTRLLIDSAGQLALRSRAEVSSNGASASA